MRIFFLVSMCILLLLSGCVQPQLSSSASDVPSGSAYENTSSSLQPESGESMIKTSESLAEIGINGMTEKEILELFIRKVNEANDIYFWLYHDCHEDIDENSEQIYDADDVNPEGFYWLPLVRFGTRKELYDYMGTVFPAKGVPNMLDWMFGDDIAGTEGEYGGDAVYIATFKEIDGRLYVRSQKDPGERRKHFDYVFETGTVAEETEGKIAVDVFRRSDDLGAGFRLHLRFENSNWVISSIPTILYD